MTAPAGPRSSRPTIGFRQSRPARYGTNRRLLRCLYIRLIVAAHRHPAVAPFPLGASSNGEAVTNCSTGLDEPALRIRQPSRPRAARRARTERIAFGGATLARKRQGRRQARLPSFSMRRLDRASLRCRTPLARREHRLRRPGSHTRNRSRPTLAGDCGPT